MVLGIYVRGFQSLREVSLALGKLTVVVGSTDVGKSALLRAIRAAVENRRGDSFVHDGTKDCQVSIVADKTQITWYKPYKKTGLYFAGPESTPLTMEDALSKLGIRPVVLSRSVILLLNFQNQLDAPFLLAESDITKSKILGEITNAGLLLFSINILKKWSLQNSSLQSIRMQDIATTRAALIKYTSLDNIFAGLSQAAATLALVKLLCLKLEKLQALDVAVTASVTLLTSLSSVWTHLSLLECQLKATSFYTGDLEIHEVLRLNRLLRAQAMIAAEVTSAKKVKARIDILKEGQPDTTTVEQLFSQLTTLQGYSDAVELASSTRVELESKLSGIGQQLQSADSEVAMLRIELKVCPLCDAPLIAQESHEHSSV